MAKLKPISPTRIAEAREEAYAVLARGWGCRSRDSGTPAQERRGAS
ncbi:hypothetical protein QF037_009925 [Streptomyces canus]|nr:hypothetical protein [Streptomyces canus]MDQ0605492.1 hypothetical protein [Streptomyces canus]